jgi:hypothetical protein
MNQLAAGSACISALFAGIAEATAAWCARSTAPTGMGSSTTITDQVKPKPMYSTKRALWPFRKGTPYHNDQVKLSATFFNNLAVASLTSAVVVPFFANKILSVVAVVGGPIITAGCLYAAQRILSDME